MRDAQRDVDSGRATFDAEGEAEIERDSRLAVQLSEHLRVTVLTWCRQHPEATDGCVLPTLIQVAAIHAMASLEMPPSDFATLSLAIAEAYRDVAQQLRSAVQNTPQA